MNDYNFESFNDKEFEKFSLDLLSQHLNQRITRFKPGKDKGVDGRYFSNDNKEIIFQCKHYFKTGYRGLIANLKKKEQTKVQKLSPFKYVLIASINLSRENKKEIKEIFRPFIKSDDDIYGREDLNDILSHFPQIEENYYKLWFSSTTIFKRIINNAIKGRSDFLKSEILKNAKLTVLTENYDKAIDKIEENRVLIISGAPGIGKTKLAESLCLHYIKKKFRLYVIDDKLSEAEDAFELKEKQIFYFDDFLGRSYLDALEKNEDSKILTFISRIKNQKNKRFILTSRTNILNQGYSYSEIFSESLSRKHNEFLIELKNLSKMDRAKILYNHLWWSKLNTEYIDEIYEDKKYKLIINHNNFNPRIIKHITDNDKLERIEASKYWEYIENSLDNPKDIWRGAFDVQSDDFIRNLVRLVVFNGGQISQEKLQNSYNTLNELENIQKITNINLNFATSIRATVRFFLNRENSNGEITYRLFNPSITDFILDERLPCNKISNLFISLKTKESLDNLKWLNWNKSFAESVKHAIILNLINSLEDIEGNDYIIKLYSLAFAEELLDKINVDKTKLIISRLNSIIINQVGTYLIDEILELILYYFKKSLIKIEDHSFLVNLAENFANDSLQINAILNSKEYFEIKDDDLEEALKDLINEYFKEDLKNRIDDIEMDLIFDYEYGDINSSMFDQECRNIIDKIETDFFYNVGEYLDYSYVMDIDYSDLEDFYRDINSEDDDYSSSNKSISFDEIDDLFERDN